MKIFLIQVNKDNELMFDFEFQLIESIKYQNWYNQEQKYKYSYVKNLDSVKNKEEYIPIGSVEFVEEFYRKFYKVNSFKPINIPKELRKEMFLGRKVWISNEINLNEFKSNNSDKEFFIKNNDGIKKKYQLYLN